MRLADTVQLNASTFSVSLAAAPKSWFSTCISVDINNFQNRFIHLHLQQPHQGHKLVCFAAIKKIIFHTAQNLSNNVLNFNNKNNCLQAPYHEPQLSETADVCNNLGSSLQINQHMQSNMQLEHHMPLIQGNFFCHLCWLICKDYQNVQEQCPVQLVCFFGRFTAYRAP